METRDVVQSFDIIVTGAGPAGVAAAVATCAVV